MSCLLLMSRSFGIQLLQSASIRASAIGLQQNAGASLQGTLLEQLEMVTVRQIFDAVVLGYGEACVGKAGHSTAAVSPDSRGRPIRSNVPVLSPQVWLPLCHWMALTDLSFLLLCMLHGMRPVTLTRFAGLNCL